MPTGFIDAGANVSFTGQVTGSQGPSTAAAPATNLELNNFGEYDASPGGVVDIQVTGVTPTNGTWNVTSNSGDVSFVGDSGMGNDNFQAVVANSWNGATIRFSIRSGTTPSGRILADATIRDVI